MRARTGARAAGPARGARLVEHRVERARPVGAVVERAVGAEQRRRHVVGRPLPGHRREIELAALEATA